MLHLNSWVIVCLRDLVSFTQECGEHVWVNDVVMQILPKHV